jgi:hypothetical protein
MVHCLYDARPSKKLDLPDMQLQEDITRESRSFPYFLIEENLHVAMFYYFFTTQCRASITNIAKIFVSYSKKR